MILRIGLAGEANHMELLQKQEIPDKLGLCQRGAEKALCICECAGAEGKTKQNKTGYTQRGSTCF